MEDLKTIEQQVLEDREAKHRQEIAEEVAKRQKELEAEHLRKQIAEENAREKLLRPLDRQLILGTSPGTIKRIMARETHQIAHLSLPEEVVEALEDAFGPVDFTSSSHLITILLRCMVIGEREGRREAQARGASYLEGRNGAVIAIPIPVEVLGNVSLEDATQLICGWTTAYLERLELQEAALKEK